MNHITIEQKENCTGCGACQNICPQNAISMQPDTEGFPYPVVNDQCVECGLCIKICPLITKLPSYGLPLDESETYAAWSKDNNTRVQSTSGGIFSELATSVYNNNGMVFGAVYDNNFMIHHLGSDNIDDLSRIRQSKYAQSDIRFTFREIKKTLKTGRQVLFCGTPCQAAGLRAFLGELSNNLLLCDFICRGNNSPLAYKAYLEMLEKKHNSKITSVQFKNKDKGWNTFHTKIAFENGTVHHQDRYTDPYMTAYLKYNLITRPCCFSCKFKSSFRNVDITLGDFWGVSVFDPALDNDMGTSVVLATSEKGKNAIKMIGNQISFCKMKVEQIEPGNACLTSSISPGHYRDIFLKKIGKIGFEKAMAKYARTPSITIIKQNIIKLLRKIHST